MKCPGQDSRYWKPGAIFEAQCPECGAEVEFFKDDSTRRCKKCGFKFLNPSMDFGCASYCKFAEQCLGELPPELVAQRKELLKDRVALEMKRYFAKDFKRIGHASKVARYAEKIAQEEKGDPAVVLSAAYLHDIGIPEAERKYGSCSGKLQEQEGPPVARKILAELIEDGRLLDNVCELIGVHHTPNALDKAEFRILWDADALVNLAEVVKFKEPHAIEAILDKALVTS